MKKISLILITILLNGFSYGQNTYITIGTNWLLPLGKNQNATMHPFNRITIQNSIDIKANYIGGFQLSGIHNMPLRKKTELYLKLSFAKTAFWEPIKATDLNAIPAGIFYGSIGNYSILASVTLQFKIVKSLSAGAGIGVNAGLIHYTKHAFGQQSNKYYYGQADGRLFNPIIPIRLQWTPLRFIFGFEYSQALLRHHRTYQNQIKGTRYGILQVDFGYRILSKKSKKK